MDFNFETMLAKIDQLPTDNAGIIGQWSIQNSPNIGTSYFSNLAAQSKLFDTYLKFRRRFNTNPIRPIEPQINDPRFDPPGAVYKNDLERRVSLLLKYDNALDDYKRDVIAYQNDTQLAHIIKNNFNPTPAGYVRYCEFQLSQLSERTNLLEHIKTFIQAPRPLPIAEETAVLGTFIVGNHGSGKSEIIKHRIWHYLTKPNPNETIVLIDPHGEIAPEVARMKPNLTNDRLVYIDPFLNPPYVPCLNFLSTSNKSPDNLHRESQSYGSALEMVSGGEMSDNMNSLCQRAAHIILEQDHFNIRDLQALINVSPPKSGKPAKTPPPVYEFAAHQSSNLIIKEFFQDNFLYGNFAQAKAGLYERITRVLEAPIAQKMLLNASRINFEELIEQRKVIVINLPFKEIGDEITAMLGQIIIAQIQIAILKRDFAKIENAPQVHLIMDEAHHFVSPQTAKQIDELRKFKLSLTLATQYIEKFPNSILESVKGLGVQMAGFCAGNNLKEMNAVFGLNTRQTNIEGEQEEAAILNNLSVGNFYYRVRGTKEHPTNIKTRQFKVDPTLLWKDAKWKQENADRYMTDEEWEICKQAQLEKYYQRIDDGSKRTDPQDQKDLPEITIPDLNIGTDKIPAPDLPY